MAMRLSEVADGVWVVEQDFELLGVKVGLRTTVLGTDDGGVVVIGPGKLEPDEYAAIGALGPVRAVIAPNGFHHLYLRRAAAAFEGARVLAAPGVAKKQPSLRVDATLGTPEVAALGVLGGGIQALSLDGAPRAAETVFFHAPSRTLVVTDSLFNVADSDHWWTRTFLTLNKAYGGPSASRIFRSAIATRTAFRASVDHMLAWEPQRIHMAHGALIESGGRDALARTYAWLR